MTTFHTVPWDEIGNWYDSSEVNPPDPGESVEIEVDIATGNTGDISKSRLLAALRTAGILPADRRDSFYQVGIRGDALYVLLEDERKVDRVPLIILYKDGTNEPGTHRNLDDIPDDTITGNG